MTWQERAECIGLDALFDHTADHPTHTDTTAAAKSLCYGCPVVQECLKAAMTEEAGHHLRHGVRGGLTATERLRLEKTA